MESSSDECSYDELYRRLFKSKENEEEEEEEEPNLVRDEHQPDQSSSLEIDDLDADFNLLSSSSSSLEEDRDVSSSSTTTGESEISPNEDTHTDDGLKPSSSSSSTRRARQAKKLEKHTTTERFLHECCILPGQPGFDKTKFVQARDLGKKFKEWCGNLRLKCPPEGKHTMRYLCPYLVDVRKVVKDHKKCGEVYFIQFRDLDTKKN